jgi:hypothetical protein
LHFQDARPPLANSARYQRQDFGRPASELLGNLHQFTVHAEGGTVSRAQASARIGVPWTERWSH